MNNKTFDELGLIGEDVVVGATASGTGVNIEGLSVGTEQYVAVIDTSDVTGTVDGSNYYELAFEASDALGGTYVQVGNKVVAPASADEAQIGFTSEQLAGLVPGANYFRITATKVGTTATAVTYTAYISKI